MFGYFGITATQTTTGEIARYVICSDSLSTAHHEFIHQNPGYSGVNVIEMQDPAFFLVEPIVESQRDKDRKRLSSQFFEGGMIGCDCLDEVYVFSFDKSAANDEADVIGACVIASPEGVTLKTVELEDLDTAHLIDRLSYESLLLYMETASSVVA